MFYKRPFFFTLQGSFLSSALPAVMGSLLPTFWSMLVLMAGSVISLKLYVIEKSLAFYSKVWLEIWNFLKLFHLKWCFWIMMRAKIISLLLQSLSGTCGSKMYRGFLCLWHEVAKFNDQSTQKEGKKNSSFPRTKMTFVSFPSPHFFFPLAIHRSPVSYIAIILPGCFSNAQGIWCNSVSSPLRPNQGHGHSLSCWRRCLHWIQQKERLLPQPSQLN